ncbi:glycerophosphodiester phosphodiesterase family protein [Sneathiella limimaris]|uniref:glycerophosphodiester phosphodiesterase family protein n=1 Tax=Sneathiella limimaris TaxID=1964213 RepID=UPI00146E118C|nr:glycerophosphodiester phosphodiesterase family protein [Sneathiella limimaris]
MPSSKFPNQLYPDWLTTVPIAHRGLHSANHGIPENSLPSFARAIDNGFAIEFDLRFSRDNEVFVFHDADLKRMTGRDGSIAQTTAAELTELKLIDSQDHIPTFKETLDLVLGQVPLVIELKPVSIKRSLAVELVLDALKPYKGDYSIQSFDPFLLLELKKQAPETTRGQLGMENPPFRMSAYRRFMLRHMPLNSLTKPHYVGYDVNSIEISAAQRTTKGKRPLLAWTVKSDTDLEKARQYADNIIFENLTPETVKHKRQ